MSSSTAGLATPQPVAFTEKTDEGAQRPPVQEITLRWEWRMFARKLSASILASVGATEQARLTHEHYILSLASPDNVKIRDEVLDIKLIERIDDNGLQQWRPALKATFPIDHEALAALWSTWRIPAPVLSRHDYTFSQLIHEIVDPEPALSLVPVEKNRSRLLVNECPGELVRLVVRGENWESLALEDSEPSRVWGAVRQLGLDGIENTSYPVGLKRIVGLVAAD